MKSKYIWDTENWKWVLESEYRKASPKRTLYFSVFKSGYNPGLGEYVGSSGDVRGALNRIEQETGSRPVAIGDQKHLEKRPTTQDYQLPRGILDAVKNGRN